MEGGVTALCTLALLNSGIEPDDPAVQKALTILRGVKPKWTYAVALQTMVFCAAEPERDLVLIRRNANWLEETQIRKGDRNGSWAYPGRGNGDNSNSQFAVLALHEAERVGVKIQSTTWQRAYNYWISSQDPGGGWGYYNNAIPDYPVTASMTCAGIAGLVITSGKVSPGDATVDPQGNIHCCGEREDDDGLENAVSWLGRNFSVERNSGSPRGHPGWLYYYLYGLERAGRLTARRFIGEHDWYREGAAQLLSKQDRLSGLWKGNGRFEDEPQISTSMALLFLSKGRRPVVISKLKYGGDDEWNNHRRDLAHLTTYTEEQWDRELTWQVIDARASRVEDFLQTPVLFISGRQAPELTERAKDLRDYIDRGGFIFAVANRGGERFDRGFRDLVAAIFPEEEYRLRELTGEHPVWHAQERIDPSQFEQLPRMYGVEYGCRTTLVYCPEDLSCLWELSRGDRDRKLPIGAQKQIDMGSALGVNVLTYATGRRPKFKAAVPLELDSDPADANAARGTVQVAKLLHGGGCNAAPGALVNLMREAGRELKLRVSTEDRQLAATDKQLFRYHLLFMHGRHEFRFTPAERKHLAAYLDRGGMLFADAICASPEFTASFRDEMKRIAREMKQKPPAALAPIPATDPLWTDAFGGYDIRTVTRRDPQKRAEKDPLQARLREVEPALEGLKVGDRYSVIFSPYDISCALEKHESLQCNGYIRDDAAKIGLNVVMYSLHQE
jgi:hypothetical protein